MKKATTSYNLKIPTETYDDLKEIAEQEGTTIAELLRKATRLLIFIRSFKDDPDAHLLVKRGDDEREIVIDLLI